MQYETSGQISYGLNLQASADLKVGASKGQRRRGRVEGLNSGLETKGWRRLNLCIISEHRCNTFVVNLCGYRLTTMFENYFKHSYTFRVDRVLLLQLHLEDDSAPSRANSFPSASFTRTPCGVGPLTGLLPDEALTEFAWAVHQYQTVFKLCSGRWEWLTSTIGRRSFS